VVPLLGLGMCALLVAGLSPATWSAFGAWSAVGLVVYFAYGRHRSKLAQGE
jgi:APA family basic amino acid/polyamine antiporter